MSTIFSSAVARTLKKTLDTVLTDAKSKTVYPSWIEESNMEDQYVDDLETAGPGLGSEMAEGLDFPAASLREGFLKRYYARKYGLRMNVTEEALEDSKYKEVIDLKKRIERAMYKTVDILCTSILARAFNTSYAGGDGLPLCSASHPLANGGTFSNLMGTPLSPSRIALTTATTAIRRMVGHDGIIEGYEPEQILCPLDQWAVWEGVVKSEKAPEPGSFNEINVVRGLGLKVTPIKYWTSSSTNWLVKTSADNGLKLKWRKKMAYRTWVENANNVMSSAMSCRLDFGWTDPRAVFGVNA